MKKHLVLIVSLVLFVFVASAQEPLPLPNLPSFTQSLEANLQVSTDTHGREVIYAGESWTWGSSNTNYPYWNGNGIRYSLTGYGPSASPSYVDFSTSHGSCSISSTGRDLYCNFGSSIPSNQRARLSFTVGYPDGANWSTTYIYANSTYLGSTTLVARPYSYASNVLQDPGAELEKLPNWAKKGASRACNKDTKIFASEGLCAIRLDNKTESATQTVTLPEVLSSGDILWISFDVMGKSLDSRAKVQIYWTDLSNKTRKANITTQRGTFEYADRWVSVQILNTAKRIKMKVIGGDGGKTYFDDIEVLPIDRSDLF